MNRRPTIAGPDPARTAIAAQRLRAGAVVALPTETVWGLAADASSEAAVRALYEIKGRPPRQPLPVLVADAHMARALAADWPDRAQELVQRFWPGPLTLVVPKSRAIPDLVTAGEPTVALRCPSHPAPLALVREFAGPLALTSANLSGQPPAHDADAVRTTFADRVFLLEGGPAPGGAASTILRLAGPHGPEEILREGPITSAELNAAP
jgi:L-threonylcarbamoyladenylate synthase